MGAKSLLEAPDIHTPHTSLCNRHAYSPATTHTDFTLTTVAINTPNATCSYNFFFGKLRLQRAQFLASFLEQAYASCNILHCPAWKLSKRIDSIVRSLTVHAIIGNATHPHSCGA